MVHIFIYGSMNTQIAYMLNGINVCVEYNIISFYFSYYIPDKYIVHCLRCLPHPFQISTTVEYLGHMQLMYFIAIRKASYFIKNYRVWMFLSGAVVFFWFGYNISTQHTVSYVTFHPSKICGTLLWRHNGRDSASNRLPHYCFLSRLFRRRSKETSKLRVTGLCAVNSPGPVNSPHKWQVTRKIFLFDDVIMKCLEI